ncbi:MAG: hypothetical protein KatS3mg081_0028 [Gemmatimonadales bacterium]|nr:MAG: hypothetical protein KatS3mg081_0028 [Gemmatimonadales bacterium]
MRVLLIHQAFVSPSEPGGTRHFELARLLRQQGIEFTIVASDLSYLTGKRLVPRRGLVTEQTIEGIRILRTYTYPSLHKSFAWRVVSFISFMATSMLAALRERDTKVIMGTSPPIFQGLSAYLVARLRRLPFVFEVRDLWPDFAVETGVLRNSALIWMARRIERFLYGHADRIVVNSPGFIPHLRRCGVPDEKIDLVPNGVEVSMFDPDDRGDEIRRELGLEGKFIALYAGAHGLANDLETVLLAAKQLEGYPEIAFILVGDGKERPNLIRKAEELSLRNVHFIPAQPKALMPRFLAAADVCIAILQPIPMLTTTYPNKVFDYMAAGRPAVLAIDGVIREVIEAADGGTFVRPGDPKALAEAVLRYYRDADLHHRQGRNAYTYVATHFSRSQQAEKLKNTFCAIVSRKKRGGFYRKFGKRIPDIVLASVGLVLLSPVALVIALAIRLSMGPPVIFRQVRPGLHGTPFVMYKFRTMLDLHDQQGNLLPDEQRLTHLGRFLRRFSLDEIPELWNVLKGDMSAVGPRPLLMEYLPLYTPEQARRHEVRPGMAGPVIMSGRNLLDWDEKFELDVWYVDNMSLWLDLKILVLTAWKVLKGEGVSAPGHETAPRFTGRNLTPNSDPCAPEKL